DEDRGSGEQLQATMHDGIKHRLAVVERVAYDSEHFRGRGLLLQRLAQLARALLFSLKKSHILYCNDRLVGEGLGKLDLLLRERSHGRSGQKNYPDRDPLAQERDPQGGAIASGYRHLMIGVFRIGKYVGDLNGFSLQEYSSDNALASRHKL